ncbi:hypothetical protein BST61_g9840 [Cercospora zeina]
MLWKIAISLFSLPLCVGVPTDPKAWQQLSTSAGHGTSNALEQHYVHEGTTLLGLMSVEDAQCLEMYLSPFSVKDLHDENVGGWESLNNGQVKLEALQSAIPELGDLAGVQGFNSPDLKVDWADEELWIDETLSLVLPHGTAVYRNLMSGANKFIISMLSDSSKIAIPDRLAQDVQKETTTRRWSDVTFFQHGELMDFGDFGKPDKDFLKVSPEGTIPAHKKGAPTWFLQHDIEEADDLSRMLSSCLATYHQWKLTTWPGLTFPIGSSCHMALLGTETSTELAMILVRYRTTIGRGLLSSVTAFEDRAGKINLLWWAAYNDATVEKIWPAIAEENEKADDAARNADTPVNAFPYPLNPAHRQNRH